LQGHATDTKVSSKSRAVREVASNANEKPSTSKNILGNDSGDEEDWDSSSNAHEDENNDHSFIGEGDEDDNDDNDGDDSGEKYEHDDDNDNDGGDSSSDNSYFVVRKTIEI
jgi:hypothetical protein